MHIQKLNNRWIIQLPRTIMSSSDSDDDNQITWEVKSDDYNPEEVLMAFSNLYETKQPLSWINWISLTVDELSDSINLNISTEDPRGSQLRLHLTRPPKTSLLYNADKPFILDVNETKYTSRIGLCRIDTNSLEAQSDEKSQIEKELRQELEEKDARIKELEEKLKHM